MAGSWWRGETLFDEHPCVVTVVMFCHCSDGMACSGVPLYSLGVFTVRCTARFCNLRLLDGARRHRRPVIHLK